MAKPDVSVEEFDKLLAGMGGQAREVETSWPDAWDFDIQPLLQGTIIELETVTMDDRSPRRASVKVGDDVYSLWESASLHRFFDGLKPNLDVLVQFTGWKDLPEKKRQREYRVAIISKRK